MNTLKKFLFSGLFLLFINALTAQVNIRDRWDTLHANVITNFPIDTSYYTQTGSLGIGNDLLIFGDSVIIDPFYISSFIHRFNPSTLNYSKIYYPKFSNDRGISCAAALTSGTSTPQFVYFGARAPYYEMLDSTLVLYKLNTTTNAVTNETIQCGGENYRSGVLNMAFFSPSTNHDTLIIFNHKGSTNGDSVNIFKKHVNQSGIINTGIKLSESVNEIRSVFNFNNTLYVGASGGSTKYLFNSTNGVSYTVNSGYAAAGYSFNAILDMDTLGGYLYIGLDGGDGDHGIIKTNDGINFISVVPFTAGVFSGFQHFQKKLFYVVENPSSTLDRPDVRYIDLYSNNTLSVDTLGRPYNDIYSFRLAKTNSHLLLSGNYNNWGDYDFGTFIYKFVPPVANFSISSSNICVNTPISFVSTSSSDSVRWFVNTNYYASTSNTFATNFTSTGSNTIGLIAITGTQKDTLKYALNIYSVSVNLTTSLNGCINNSISLNPTTPGAISPISYSWNVSSGLTAGSLSTASIAITATTSGAYTYSLSVTDANGCSANSSLGNLSVNPNTNLSGVASISSTPVNGDIVLYRYEPILTKFDSVTYVSTGALGQYTFTNFDAGVYIMKCIPTDNSLQVTYAPSAVGWKDAVTITHGCVSNTNQNINVVPLTLLPAGPGVLSGKIVEGINYGRGLNITAPGNPIRGMTVKGGRNPGGDIVAQGKTNAAGEYTLSNFPINTNGESYFILVDIPGLDTNGTYHRAIVTGSLQYTDLNFYVDSAKINPGTFVSVKENIAFEEGIVTVYPNPSNGYVTVEARMKKAEHAKISISDINGKLIKVLFEDNSMFVDEFRSTIDLSGFDAGIYLMGIEIGVSRGRTKLILTN